MWASDPTVTARPPSRVEASDDGRRGNVSSAGWRSPLVLISRAVPLSTSAAQDRLVQLGGGGEVGAVVTCGTQVALHEVDVAHRIEQAGPGAGLDLVEVRRDDLLERPAGDPAGDWSAAYGESR